MVGIRDTVHFYQAEYEGIKKYGPTIDCIVLAFDVFYPTWNCINASSFYLLLVARVAFLVAKTSEKKKIGGSLGYLLSFVRDKDSWGHKSVGGFTSDKKPASRTARNATRHVKGR